MGLQEFFPYDQVGEDEYFDARLHEQGLELSDIDYVVLSHLHFDHAGNAQLFGGTGAKMVCSKNEHDFAFGFDGVLTGGHLKADYDKLKWETVDGDAELLPGATLIQVPGHTPGTMAMRVDLPETGTMIFTSDAVFMGDTYGPPATPGIPDQRSDRLVPVGREDPKAGGGDQRHVGVRSRLRSDEEAAGRPRVLRLINRQ